MNPWVAVGTGVLAAGAAGLTWGLAEAHAFVLRRVEVPVLADGQEPVRVLHISDLHLTARQRDKVRWVRGLAEHRPDLVVLTGDNLGAPDAVDGVAEALAPLAGVPGVFVFGSNDYFGPRRLNPFMYFGGPSRLHPDREPLPTEELRAALVALGWHDLNNARAMLRLGDLQVSAVGMDDPHLALDRMPAEDGVRGALHLGVVHAPYARALEALAADGAKVVLAGHTHGGQVCLPGFGALVTNCDLDRRAASGLSRVAAGDREDAPFLHVSAGLGTSPFAPVRFACRPSATMLTLVPARG